MAPSLFICGLVLAESTVFRFLLLANLCLDWICFLLSSLFFPFFSPENVQDGMETAFFVFFSTTDFVTHTSRRLGALSECLQTECTHVPVDLLASTPDCGLSIIICTLCSWPFCCCSPPPPPPLRESKRCTNFMRVSVACSAFVSACVQDDTLRVIYIYIYMNDTKTC